MRHLTFVIGGARSGKSQFAEQLALDSFANTAGDTARLHYLATAQAFDDEMRIRIARHQERRSGAWHTTEAALDVPEQINAISRQDAVILIDCLSVWTTNLLINDIKIEVARSHLETAITASTARIICVASETGLGIVPDNALSRQFRDANGQTNQTIAKLADDVYFMVAGIAQKIKP
jgi:adenosylcobinamide kinase/adenosylcobinamide-phosphate guanylyltransferase